jgi:hypothetical protein
MYVYKYVYTYVYTYKSYGLWDTRVYTHLHYKYVFNLTTFDITTKELQKYSCIDITKPTITSSYTYTSFWSLMI